MTVTGALVKGKGAAEKGEGVAVVSVSGSRLGVAVSGEAEGLQTWPLTVGCNEVGRRDGSREVAATAWWWQWQWWEAWESSWATWW